MGIHNFSINTDNSAFREGNSACEVARILRDMADSIEGGDNEPSVKDFNGNTVGESTYTMSDSEAQLSGREKTVDELSEIYEELESLHDYIKECDDIIYNTNLDGPTFDEKDEAIHDKKGYMEDFISNQKELNEDQSAFPTGLVLLNMNDNPVDVLNTIKNSLSIVNAVKEELIELQLECGIGF